MDLPRFDPVPVTLDGALLTLRPLVAEDAAALAAACPPGTTKWFPSPLDTLAAWQSAVALALTNQASGTEVPFCFVERATGVVCGTSRYLAIERNHRRLEIGWTAIGPAWQGTGVNEDAKLAMLEHAFTGLGAIRVEFKTDSLNQRSRAALAAIGAVEEGTFRNLMIVAEGRRRHSVYFAITSEDWPATRAALQARRDQRRAGFANRA